MIRLLVHAKDYTLNLEVTRIELINMDNTVAAYNKDKLIGIFNIDDIKSIYILTCNKEKEN